MRDLFDAVIAIVLVAMLFFLVAAAIGVGSLLVASISGKAWCYLMPKSSTCLEYRSTQ
jgi:hypothetical protein